MPRWPRWISCERLGAYRYNYSPIETMRCAAPDMGGRRPACSRLLDRFRPLGRSGDVYARLTGSTRSTG